MAGHEGFEWRAANHEYSAAATESGGDFTFHAHTVRLCLAVCTLTDRSVALRHAVQGEGMSLL